MRRDRGFTLVEMLVVIGIIAILAGIAFPVMSGMKTRGKVTATKMLIENLKQSLEHYANVFGDYPPSNPKLVGLPVTGTNDGNKCLVRCLTSKTKEGPYYQFPEETLKADDMGVKLAGNPTNSYIESKELFLVVDGFGNPLIYLHNADYDNGARVELTNADGSEAVKVKGVHSKKTNQFFDFNKFQLWSAGPNGKAENGEYDDITSWGGAE